MLIPLLIAIVSSLFPSISCAFTTPPIPIANAYFQSMPVYIKTGFSSTFSSSNPITKTVPFTKTYTQAPMLAYALKNYRSDDRLLNQNWILTRNALSATSFTIYTQLGSATSIRILSIMYLAIDKTIPYHINAFSDIQVNHTNGAIVNIGTTSIGIRTYTNVINYTTLSTSTGATHTTFGTNLARSNIALFTTGIYAQTNDTGVNPSIRFDITGQVISTDLFEVKIVVQNGYQIYQSRFSFIGYDLDSVEPSDTTTVIFTFTYLTGASAHSIAIPQTFFTSILLGLVDYAAANSDKGLEFNWQPDFFNNQCIVNQSAVDTGNSSANGGLSGYNVAVFYVKSWYCPATHSYFDRLTHICHSWVCGDGYWLMILEPCDDGNTVNGDGCSALCQVETDFECLAADQKATGESFCKYTKNITLTFVEYQKQQFSNTLILFFSLSPVSTKYWTQTSVSALITAMQLQSADTTVLIPQSNITMKFDPTASTKQIRLTLNYDNNIIQNSDFTITIAPSNTNIAELVHLASFSYTIRVSSTSSISRFYNYPQEIYDIKSQGYLKTFSQYVGFGALAFLLIGFVVPVGKLIVLESLAVIQISFFSLMQLDLVPVTYDDLKYLRYSTGYFDISQFLSINSTQQDTVYQMFGLSRIIFSNINFAMLLFIIPLIVGTIGLVSRKICKSSKSYQQNSQYNYINHNTSRRTTKTYQSKIDFQSPHTQRFFIEFFKRTLLEGTFYGILICGYLFWISVLYSFGEEKRTQNIIMYAIVGFIWLLLVVLFVKDDSQPIRSWECFTEKEHTKIGLEDTQILTGFGEFRHPYHHVSMQKRPTYSRWQKLYLLPTIDRFLFPIIINIVSPIFLYSSAIIGGILLLPMLIFPRAYLYCQNNLPFNQKKSVFCFLYQNYMIRQSFNFLCIMAVQGLILTYRILSVIVTNSFTTIKIPLILLSILAFNLLVNFLWFLFEIRHTKTMMKIKLIFAIFYFVRDDKQLSIQQDNKIELKQSFIQKGNNEDQLQRNSNKTQKRISRHMKILDVKQDDHMNDAISSYVRNSLLFKKDRSPYLGLHQRESPGRKPLTPKMDITTSSLAGKIVKRNSLFTESPVKNSQVTRSLKF